MLEPRLEGLTCSTKSIVIELAFPMSVEQPQNMSDGDEEKMNVDLQGVICMDRPCNVVDRDGRNPAPSFGLMKAFQMRFDSFQLAADGSSPEPSRGVSPAKETGSIAQ